MSLTKLRNSLPELNGESLDFFFDHRLDDVFELHKRQSFLPHFSVINELTEINTPETPKALIWKCRIVGGGLTIVESIERQKTTQRARLAQLNALFAAHQLRAFRGEL